MIEAFGSRPIHVTSLSEGWTPAEEMETVRARLSSLSLNEEGQLLLFRGRPTAAFSRRDALLPGYPAAVRAVSALGFTPVVRPVGGHLAVYDEGSLLMHLWAPHARPQDHTKARFLLAGGAIADALRALGIDARVGPVPGEYCDGQYSVNRAGSAKLAGTGQRITRRAYLFSAVVMVNSSAPVTRALAEAYGHLGLQLRRETIGAVTDSVPGVTVSDVRRSLLDALAGIIRSSSESAAITPPISASTATAVGR